MTTISVLPKNDLILKSIQGIYGFILNSTFFNFLEFYEKNPCKKKKFCKNCFGEQGKP